MGMKILAGLIVALMGALWIYGQDMLDQMALTIAPIALLLPVAAGALCGAAWWVRNRRQMAAGSKTAIEPGLRRAEAYSVAGLFVVAFMFAFALDRLGHTPHQSVFSASVAAAWDSTGIICIVFCGACFGGGRRR